MALLWFLQDMLRLDAWGKEGESAFLFLILKDNLRIRKSRIYSSKVTLWQVIFIIKLLNNHEGGDHISLSLELQ